MGNRSNGRQKAGKLREFTTVVTVQFVVSTNARSHGEAERKLDLGFYGKKGEAVGPLWRAEQDGDVRIRVAHKRADMIVEKRHGAIEREIREHGKSPSTDLAAAVAKLSAKRTVWPMTPNNIRKVRNAISMSQYALADKGVQATLRLRGFSCSTARC